MKTGRARRAVLLHRPRALRPPTAARRAAARGRGVGGVAPQIEGKLLYLRTADGARARGARVRRDSVAHRGGRGRADARGRRVERRLAATDAGARRRPPSCGTTSTTFTCRRAEARRRSELGGVALLQRPLGRPEAVGVRLVHRRRRRAARGRTVGRPGARHAARAGQARSAASRARCRRRGCAALDDATPTCAIGESRVDACCRTAATRVRARAREEGSGAPLDAGSRRHPGAGRLLPRRGARRAAMVSGYAVPALRADAQRHALRRGRVRRRTTARRRTTTTTGACGAASPGSGARRAPASTRCCTAACEPPDSVSGDAAAVRVSGGLARLPRASSVRGRSATMDARTTRVDGRDHRHAVDGGDGGRARRRHAAPHAADRGRDRDRYAHRDGGAWRCRSPRVPRRARTSCR